MIAQVMALLGWQSARGRGRPELGGVQLARRFEHGLASPGDQDPNRGSIETQLQPFEVALEVPIGLYREGTFALHDQVFAGAVVRNEARTPLLECRGGHVPGHEQGR